jgi:N-acetylneuraminic acid mutarotase
MQISMQRVFILLLLCGTLAAQEIRLDSIPVPITNNAVAGYKTHGEVYVFSFMGLGEKKTAESVTSDAYALDTYTDKWDPIHPVPGPVGRIASVAETARGHIFLFGGYVVEPKGLALAVPDVNTYEPPTGRWSRGQDMPVEVGDAIAAQYQDRYIYIIGGRSNHGVVADVQLYDTEKNTWSKATPIPGTPVFGHAGGMVGDTIVYIGGAARNSARGGLPYLPSDECWMGKIDHHDRSKIQWTKLPAHPGNASFRIAAGASERDQKIYFTGGTDNPYDMAGTGYDGKPSVPSPVTFDFNIHTKKWETIDENTSDPTMDHRGLIATTEGLIIVGGMDKDQKVTPRVQVLDLKPAPEKKPVPEKKSKPEKQPSTEKPAPKSN